MFFYKINMITEYIHDGIRYTLTNEGLNVGDKVFPIAMGRSLDDGSWIFHNYDFSEVSSGFPNEAHEILDLNHSEYKPYQVHTDYGYGPVEMYYKVIKREILPVPIKYRLL